MKTHPYFTEVSPHCEKQLASTLASVNRDIAHGQHPQTALRQWFGHRGEVQWAAYNRATVHCNLVPPSYGPPPPWADLEFVGDTWREYLAQDTIN